MSGGIATVLTVAAVLETEALIRALDACTERVPDRAIPRCAALVDRLASQHTAPTALLLAMITAGAAALELSRRRP